MPMSRTAAAVMIQRFVRSRVLSSGQAARNMWSNITSNDALEKLRALYLDERAIRAGAKDSALYTDEMLAKREALRTHEVVHRSLENLWVSIPRVAADSLSMDEYMTLARKLYLITMVEQRMLDKLDPNEWRDDAQIDFKSDGHGKSTLTKDEFFAAWFECADVHTIEVSAPVYAGWLDKKAEQMTKLFSGPAPNPSLLEGLNVREWRSDAEIMAFLMSPFAGGNRTMDNGSFKKNRNKSVDSFPSPGELPPVSESFRKSRRRSSDEILLTTRFDVGAQKRWFDAVKEEELRESETVKQLARAALDAAAAELSFKKKNMMPLGGRTGSRDGSEVLGGMTHRDMVADPKLQPWVAPGTWLPDGQGRAHSISMAKMRAKEAHDDFLLSDKRARELAAQALNMRSPHHRPRRQSVGAVPLRWQTDANGRLWVERDDR